MAAKKGFQGFVDPNGKNLDFFETLETIMKTKQKNNQKQGVSGYSGKSGYYGVTGMTGTTTVNTFVDNKFTPPVEQPKVKNKVVFNIEKIS